MPGGYSNGPRFLSHASLAAEVCTESFVCVASGMVAESNIGLEWDHVFLAGISDGVLPMGNDVEEERRLFYVGLTRAKSELHLSYSGTPSPFLSGIL